MPVLSEKDNNFSKIKIFFIIIIPLMAIVFSCSYLVIRTAIFIISDYKWYEKTAAFFLLAAEAFILMHGIGYFQEIYRVLKRGKKFISFEEDVKNPENYPPIAVIVTSYKEPLEVVEKTITCFYNLTYPNKFLYFLDDTKTDLPDKDPESAKKYKADVEELCKRVGVDLFRRKWRGAKAGIINDFVNFVEGKKDENFKFYNYSGKKPEKPKYIVIFDADQNAFPSFAEPLVARMENNPELAFIQTPQYYTNFEKNRVARASGFQQAVFYEYISEGKGIEEAMFACGTNIIIRYDALLDVGGFEEKSVTEDFATSLKFHIKGWKSAYYNKAMAFGMGPEDLGSYFKQQGRWAHGTISLFRIIAAQFFKNPAKLPFAIWWEYFLSSTYYFIGLVFIVLVLCPVFYLLFKVPSYFVRPDIYVTFFIPYFLISLLVFYWTLYRRNYNFGDLLFGQFLIGVTSPVYAKASILALLGFKAKFNVTAKSGSKSLRLTDIWVQILIALLCLAAFTTGLYRIFVIGDKQVWAIAVNMFWCAYHFFIMTTVFYFNNPEEK